MSFPRFRRQHHQQAFSPTSSEDLSPTVPVLDNPITFQALAARFVPEVSLRKKKKQGRAAAMPSMFLEEEKEEEDTPAPNLVRASSEDGKPDNAAKKNVEEAQARKTRTQYYDDIFNSRGPEHSSKTLITHDSVVVVEIKTNIKVKEEELKLVSDLTFRLAQIYQRPETSMMVTIQQGACLHFGNSSLPAYLMKVFGHPYIIAPITNLRNTILIQRALDEFLDIAPSRGVIIYTPVPEENYAIDGVTIMGEIVRRSQESQNEGVGIFKTITRSMSRKLKSNSSNSAPLSVTTTSSQPRKAESQEAAPDTGKNSHVKESSSDESQP